MDTNYMVIKYYYNNNDEIIKENKEVYARTK